MANAKRKKQNENENDPQRRCSDETAGIASSSFEGKSGTLKVQRGEKT